MKRLLRWLGVILAGLVTLLLVAAALVFFLTQARLSRTYDIAVTAISVPSDAQTVARGAHLAVIRGCTDCHGPDLAGGVFIDDPALGTLYAGNLTSGRGGVGRMYTDLDWVRAIRHGVGPDGKPLLYMPAQEFYYLSDEDLGALIAYLKELPPVDKEWPASHVGPLGRVLFLAGQLPLVPAEMIDHQAPRPPAPPPGITVAYGRYLATGCVGCHMEDFAGGPIPGAPPDWPPAANLTPAGPLSEWSEADFFTAMRTGVKPNGEPISPVMPFQSFGAMTDAELKALWLFLQSLPPVVAE